MPQDGAARFRPLAVKPPGGGGLFLQAGPSSGGKIEAVTFQVLGQAAHRAATEYDTAAVMQLVHYDCNGRTRQILRQAGWNRFGRLQTVGDTEGSIHPAAESPLLDRRNHGRLRHVPRDQPDFRWLRHGLGLGARRLEPGAEACLDRRLRRQGYAS